MHYNTMKFSVGLFIISLFLGLFTFIFFLLQEKGTFEARHSYHFTVDTAEGFRLGMPIQFSGFNIGVIDAISLQESGLVDMEFSVRQKHHKWLTDGSVLMMIKPLIGASHIELYTSMGTPLLQDKDKMTMLFSDNINDLIVKLQPVVEKALSILNNIERITSYLAEEDSELKQILKNLAALSKKLANDDSLLTSLTGDKKASQALVKSLNQTSTILKDINKITASLNADIVKPASTTIKELEAIMKDVKAKLDAIDSTVQAVGGYDKDFIELKKQISVGVQKSNQIMDKVDALMQNKSDSNIELP
ncbi:MAG: hypothetical protein Q9M32_00360 [Sulfurimonas sp.]|nr:hypothetical protein [Sulfurimonas sp.]MDQ7060255.1 hypothetical protein [Sulfurimonas sp.]